MKKSVNSQIADPVCGWCGKKFSEHFHEKEDYCYPNTTGDTFRDEPTDEWIYHEIENNHPELIDMIIRTWQRNNGHKV